MREKRFVVEGAKNVLELLKSDFSVDLVLCSEAFYESSQPLLEGIRTELVTSKVLEQVGSFTTNESCVAVAKSRDLTLDELDYSSLIFVLDGVSDPGNLGTIIRTLDWFGFDQLVCSTNTAELYNPKVISSTMGSFTRVKVYYTDLGSFIGSKELTTYAATMSGKSLFDLTLKEPAIVVLGSESHGISEEIIEKVDIPFTIPGSGQAESLNVGIATGIVASYLRML